MAKDVDLSSKEWTDLVFEGKNKEYGAYTLRSGSVKRHNIAVICVLSVLAVILILLILIAKGVFKTAEDDMNVDAGKEAVTIAQAADDEEEIEDIPLEIPDEPEPVQEEEEVTATQQVTEVVIKNEINEDKKVKDVDQLLENTSDFGSKDHEGVEDSRKEIVKEKVVEEAPKPVVKKDNAPVNMAIVEQKPMFPGGEAAMYKWLGDQIQYPAAASEEGVQGRVVVQFIVEENGSISHVNVVRGKHPALDAEALRVVKKMPKWNPGRNNGQPVRVIYNLPVTFKLKQ
ncbi:MAG: energy transducer TonB [Muribaculaceae bacterium]